MEATSTPVRAARRAGVALVLTALLVGASTGCGDPSRQAARPAGAAAELHGVVDRIRGAAERGDRLAAGAAVSDFRAAVHRLLERGALDEGEALALLSQVDQIGDRLIDAVPTPTATTAPAAPAPASAASHPVSAGMSGARLPGVARIPRAGEQDEGWRGGQGKRHDDGKRRGGGKKRGWGGDDDD